MNDPLFQSASQMDGANNYNDWVFDLFRPILRGRVLEVGCGVGTFTKRIVRSAPDIKRLLSVDILPASIEYCRTQVHDPRVEFRCMDAVEVNGGFDAVICMNVLEHIKDDVSALRHMVDLLRSNGQLFLLVPAHQWLYCDFDREGGHYRRYNRSDVIYLFEQVAPKGGHDLSIRYFNLIGAIGYYMVYTILRRKPRGNAGTEIGIFDRWIVPVWRKLEGPWVPMGISVVACFTKRGMGNDDDCDSCV